MDQIFAVSVTGCSPLGCVTTCVVYGRFDSKIRFERKKTIRRSLIYGPYTIFIYLLTYYFRFRSGTRVPVVLPGGYPGNKLLGYGSPSHHEAVKELLQEKNPEAAQEAAQTFYGYINTERTADIAKFLVDRTNIT